VGPTAGLYGFREKNLLSPPEFETRTVQPVAYRYTAHPNPAPRQAYTI